MNGTIFRESAVRRYVQAEAATPSLARVPARHIALLWGCIAVCVGALAFVGQKLLI